MRRTASIALLCLMSVSAWAQDDQKNVPKGSEALPAPPPPPAGLQPDEFEPKVTIIQRGEDVVEEYRIHGRLYMVKVTPKHGKPYYLVDQKGDGQFTRQDSLDSGMRVPQWVLFQF